MAQRAGRALRENWAAEAAYRADPGYHHRHVTAGQRRAEIIRRYVNAVIAAGVDPFTTLEMLVAAQERVRVIEQDRQFRVTARKEG